MHAFALPAASCGRWTKPSSRDDRLPENVVETPNFGLLGEFSLLGSFSAIDPLRELLT